MYVNCTLEMNSHFLDCLLVESTQVKEVGLRVRYVDFDQCSMQAALCEQIAVLVDSL